MNKLLIWLVILLGVNNVSAQIEIKDMSKEFPCSGCYNSSERSDAPNARIDSLKPVELNHLQEVFNDIVKNSGIEFNYPQAACQQRTQYLSMLLSKKYKIEHFRVWLFSPVNLDVNGADYLTVVDKNNLTDAVDNKITWAYHVAPAVKINGKVYVIDPSLNNKNPMILDDWFKSIGNSEKGKYSFLDSEFYFFNRQNVCFANKACPINGFFYRFEGNSKDSRAMEKGLAINDAAMKIYSKYLLPLKESTKTEDKAKFNELKKVYGNYENLEGFLFIKQDWNSNNEIHKKYGYLHSKYKDMTNETLEIYLERLVFWSKKTNELLSMN